MKKYFIFSINREFYETYKKNEDILYKTLSNLYTLKNTKRGLAIYSQVCNPINKNLIKEYLKKDQKHFKLEKTILEVNYSCLILLTPGKIPKKLKNMKYHEAPLFVTDFKNKNYFWLSH